MTVETRFKKFFKTIFLFRAIPLINVKGQLKISGGTFVDGIYQEPSFKYTKYSLNAVIQPALDRDMNQNSTKQKNDRNIIGDIDIYTSNELKLNNIADNTTPDLVIYENKVYELKTDGKWDFLGETFFKYTGCYIPKSINELENESIASSEIIPNPPLSQEDLDNITNAIIFG